MAFSDTSDFRLPLSNALGKIMMYNLQVWWIYLAMILIMFIYMTSRNRNDFKNMEHGSARWANDYEIKRFQKNKSNYSER